MIFPSYGKTFSQIPFQMLYCFPLNASSSGHIHHSWHLSPVFFPIGPALYLHLGMAADQNIVLQGDLRAVVNDWPEKQSPELVSYCNRGTTGMERPAELMAWEVVFFQWQETAIDLCI